MVRYNLHPQVEFHYASDESGILVYSGFSGTTVRLSYALKPLVDLIQTDGPFDKALLLEQLGEVDAQQSEDVLNALRDNYILTSGTAQ